MFLQDKNTFKGFQTDVREPFRGDKGSMEEQNKTKKKNTQQENILSKATSEQ